MFVLLQREEYYIDLAKKIDRSTNKVYIMVMELEFFHLDYLLNSIINAIHRGVEVILKIDYFSKYFVQGHNIRQHIRNHKENEYIQHIHEVNMNSFKRIEETGGAVIFTKKPKSLSKFYTIFGRNHIKISIVDNYVYFGGMNIAESWINKEDFMLRISNNSRFLSVFLDIFNNFNAKKHDDTYVLDKDSTLLFDSGKIGSSIIYSKAKELIRNARQRITYISQYHPDFSILKILNKNSKRVDIKVITHNREVLLNSTKTKESKAIQTFISRIENILIREKFIPVLHNRLIHAKVLFVDDEHVLIGSHNYTFFGVLFGTNEICLYTKDKEVISLISGWINKSFPENH